VEYLGNRVLTWLEDGEFGLSLSEFQTGYHAFRREALETVKRST